MSTRKTAARAILLLCAVNAVLLYFVSFVAVYGDGSRGGIYAVRIYGGAWIAGAAIWAAILWRKGRYELACIITIATLPASAVMAPVLIMVTQGLYGLRPHSTVFMQACERAGPKYIASPAMPVRSIAYDWNPNAHPPALNHFAMDWHGNVSKMRREFPRFPNQIEFIEERCCQYGAGVKPYLRHPRSGSYYGVTELTADVLVEYKTTDRDTALVVDMTVSDRRDGRALATLHYVLDYQGRRGCGETSPSVMDEREFVVKAIGLQQVQ